MTRTIKNTDSITGKKFIEAINLFNDEKFYECHDVLEDIWFEKRDSSRDFYQGLIHLAVGFYHLKEKKNLTGALRQLDKSIKKLTQYKPGFEGIELEKLTKRIGRTVNEIKKGDSFILKSIPKIKFI
jgi:predicted metal-dependent hydrolase